MSTVSVLVNELLCSVLSLGVSAVFDGCSVPFISQDTCSALMFGSIKVLTLIEQFICTFFVPNRTTTLSILISTCSSAMSNQRSNNLNLKLVNYYLPCTLTVMVSSIGE